MPAASDDWERGARELLRGWRAAMLRHPWSAALVGRPLLGPNVLRRTERLHALLADAGLDEHDLTAAAHALANCVVGSALTQSSWNAVGGPDARDAARARLAGQAGAYPTLAAQGHFDDRDEDALFDRGLDLLFAGIAGRER